jgi:LuxR family maltose regulon positive regulatory protein
MAIASIEFTTKVLVPRRRQDTIRRQRLLDFLHECIHLRIEIVSAPAGYGKTTLLVDFANDLDIPVCWYSLDAYDQDPRLLLEGILASIRSRFPGFGQLIESRLLLTEDIGIGAPHLVSTLAGEIYESIPDYFVLILEDYHYVQDSDPAKRILDLFVSRIPENCHVIISSRTPVELPSVASLKLQRYATSLSASDLSFTATEVRELLATQGLQVSDEQAEKLSTETEGWIAGILLSTYGKGVSQPSKTRLTLSRENIFHYLATEVYAKQSPDVKRFLLTSSTLNEMEPDVCQRLLGIVNSGKLLQYLERQNLFTIHLGEKPWYRYHHLFREFLQAKLLEENPEEYALLHHKAALLFEQEERWNEAITHFLAAKEYGAALRAIKIAGENFIKSGKWATVSKWVEALPKNMLISDPELMLLQAQSLIHIGQVDEGVRLLTKILVRNLAHENWLYRAKALSWRSAAFRLTGHFTEAKRDVQAAIHLLEQHNGPADVLGDAYRRLGSIYADRGYLRTAIKYQRWALKQYTAILDVGKIAAVHNELGNIYESVGDLTEATLHFERAREGLQKVKNYGAMAITLNNIGMVYCLRGQYDLALDTFNSGLDKARETGYRRAEALILINKAEVLRNLELYDEALTIYREGLELAREVMETYYVAHATAGIGETYRLLAAHDKAEVLLKEAVAQAKEQGQNYEAALFTMQLGIIECERGRYEKAMGILLNVSDRLRNTGDKDSLAKAYFHLAQVSFLSKKYDLAIDWLEKVSQLADELGYEDFLAIEGRNSTLLIQYAVSKQVGGDRFVRIMEKIREHNNVNNRLRMPEVSTLPRVIAKPVIEARAFGETLVTISDRQIGESEWRSNRAKEIFFYLLHCKKGQTKEQITAKIWPDLSPAKGTSNFHINLYRARRAVFPGIFALEHGRYKLNPDLDIRFDVAEFEDLLLQADNLPHESEARMTNLEQAIQLYRGNFMEGFYGEWVEIHRRYLEDKYLRTLASLAGFYAVSGRYQEAIALLEKFITIDPYQDEIYGQIMEWHLVLGEQPAALRVYRRYINTVVQDTENALPPYIQALRNRILVGKETS